MAVFFEIFFTGIMPVPPTEFVAMLLAAKNGDTVVADRLFAIIYDELDRLARGLV